MEEKGFTLSEVLIALVIIGVLAAILIPATMNNTNSHEYRSGYKKAISVLNQALARHFALERMTAQDYDSAESLVISTISSIVGSILIPQSERIYTDSTEAWLIFSSQVSFVKNIGKLIILYFL